MRSVRSASINIFYNSQKYCQPDETCHFVSHVQYFGLNTYLQFVTNSTFLSPDTSFSFMYFYSYFLFFFQVLFCIANFPENFLIISPLHSPCFVCLYLNSTVCSGIPKSVNAMASGNTQLLTEFEVKQLHIQWRMCL